MKFATFSLLTAGEFERRPVGRGMTLGEKISQKFQVNLEKWHFCNFFLIDSRRVWESLGGRVMGLGEKSLKKFQVKLEK